MEEKKITAMLNVGRYCVNEGVEEEQLHISGNLPRDILLEILSRLPLKSLSNFCWDLGFVSEQFRTTAYSLRYIESVLTSSFRLLGSVNGLLCLTSVSLFYHPFYYIFNPISKEEISLPESPRYCSHSVGSGFGFDLTDDKYKVVRILHAVQHKNNAELHYLEAKVYILGSGRWRAIKSVAYGRLTFDHSLFLNGYFYWAVNSNPKLGHVIVSLSVSTEEFCITLFSPVNNDAKDIVLFEVFEEHLCFIGRCFHDSLEIWMMKDNGMKNSWTKGYVSRTLEGM
ncbi:hypothetical protein IFM89_033953 [Coptis chinensis]|uniref:F-box protein n=1 Tax=Coptis chinensis TaxID=261450 RepID=A0A835HWE2_9MAGN|nr:hypothetical protein IFM89_033953 [Coptis chinensis]